LIGRVSVPVELLTVTLVVTLVALALDPAWLWFPIPVDDAEMPVAEFEIVVATVLIGAAVPPDETNPCC